MCYWVRPSDHHTVKIRLNNGVKAAKTYRHPFQGEFSFDEVNHLQIRQKLLIVPCVAFKGHVLDESDLDLTRRTIKLVQGM